MKCTLAFFLSVTAAWPQIAGLDEVVEKAIQDGQIPGAVLLVGRNGNTLHYKAYGQRSLEPKQEAMTLDTIFDAASLTKVIATTSSIMKLFEQGKIRLNDRVTVYLPEFQGGKSDITIRNLMTHFSGLRPDLDLKPAWSGYEVGVKKALIDKPASPPGEKFVYSDINYILLGEIVRRISGRRVDVYSREEIFLPLGMTDSMFNPPASLRPRIAPTEHYSGDSGPLRGVVHDETTKYMGGVAGHAGLFTTARDLQKFAEMMIHQGEYNGVKLFSPLSVRKFTEPQTPPDQAILRGLGWDMDSPYSSNRGELYPIGSFGHTGFTGTSVWIDPSTQSYVIFLSNSVHPHRRPAASALRSRIATIVAASLGIDVQGVTLTGYNETLSGAGIHRPVAHNGQVRTGFDVLAADRFAPFKGKRVGLITNHTGRTSNGSRNIDIMLQHGVKLTALYSPEHGIAGKEDRENIGHSKDPATKLPVWSLYSGSNRKPSPEMLNGIDVLAFDIQDVGARFYTYLATLKNAMEEAAKHKIPFFVLDRPNPITGVKVEGPMLDRDAISFVGCYPMPLRHGMTLGELATMINAEEKLGADLRVIKMQNWSRGDWFDSTGLVWIDPSPNMRSLNAALLYPGVAMLEYSRNYSVGRGTDAPFEQVGADWIDGSKLAHYLNGRQIPGVRLYATRFTPRDSYFKDKEIQGVRFVVTDRMAFDSTRLGMELGVALEKLYPGKIQWDANKRLIGSKEVLDAMKAAKDPRLIQQAQMDALQKFAAMRLKYLLY
jgi:uncharacterized protein YbbC (DUF1343 family)/CubicO group peptidase (beta-lactamase class C family)